MALTNSTKDVSNILGSTEPIAQRCSEKHSLKLYFKKAFNTDTLQHENCQKFQNIFFVEDMRTATSGSTKAYLSQM